MAANGDSAPRRTSLAAERTYLAWLRTGLAALGLALAVGRLIPALIDVHRAPFAALGLGYGIRAGVISASNDESTGESVLNPEFMKTLTLGNLQNLKTPWGRQYLAFAMDFGETWGIS